MLEADVINLEGKKVGLCMDVYYRYCTNSHQCIRFEFLNMDELSVSITTRGKTVNCVIHKDIVVQFFKCLLKRDWQSIRVTMGNLIETTIVAETDGEYEEREAYNDKQICDILAIFGKVYE